jgi:hypothetical protein
VPSNHLEENEMKLFRAVVFSFTALILVITGCATTKQTSQPSAALPTSQPKPSVAVPEAPAVWPATFKSSFDAKNPLPSWNDGPAKQAIIDFVKATTDASSPKFVPVEKRIATFDQDGTTWVEKPLYTQIIYCLEKFGAIAQQKTLLSGLEATKVGLSGDQAAMGKLDMGDIEQILILYETLTGMTVTEFSTGVEQWLRTTKNQRWKRPFTDLVYQPMLEVMEYLRANGFKTYIVTGGGQDFVRVYSNGVYGIPREQVAGTAGATKFSYDANGKPVLNKVPKLLLDDDKAGKPEGIHLFIGLQPLASFGNSIGDRQMLEYTGAGDGARLMMLVHHDDAVREYAYGPDSKVGTFSDALMAEAKQKGWTVISMKDDWKHIFAFEK